MRSYGLFIGGEWVETQERMDVIEKHTGKVMASVAVSGPAEVDAAVSAAADAFQRSRLTPFERYRILSKAASIIRAEMEELSQLLAREAGKPIKDARVEVSRSADLLDISAEEAKRIHGEVLPVEATPGAENRRAFTIRVPVGVVCAISPFNFPLMLALHKIGPAIAAGNTVVFKPSEQTPCVAAELCRILDQAGLPRGHINMVNGGPSVGAQLCKDQRINFYSFTGSAAVGQIIKESTGLRRVALELGNNSATIVHKDANLAKAAKLCAMKSFAYAGQVCISLQRILVHEEVAEEFTRLLLQEVEAIKVGDPLDPATSVGPMISEKEARRAEAWVNEAASQGARVLCGGRREGAFFYPTVLGNVTPDMKVACQEVFAPIVSILTYTDIEAAFDQVNDSPYGLQAGIFTESLQLAFRAAERIAVGGVMINDASAFRADALPYGGVKNSGIGREGPRYAIEEMTDLKTVIFNL